MIIMNSVAMNHKMSAVDSSLLAVNRSKLMKLAEGIKTKKKPNHKKTINFKKDPGYTNIEHLVFGTYRPKTSPSNALSTVGHNVPPRSQSPTNGCFTGDSECPLDFGGSVQRFPAKSVCEEGKNGCSREVRDSVSTEVIPNDDLNSTSQKYHLSPSALPVVKLIADENGRDHLQSPVSNVLKESQLLKQQTTNGSIGNVPISSSSNNCNLSHGEFNLAFDVDECDFSLSASDNEHYVKDVTSHPQQCGTDSTQTSDKQGIPIIASPNGIGTVTDRLLDASLHSPPVHMLIKGKYVTHEFSADFSSPEVVVSPLDSSILCKETVASSKSIGKARSSFLYRPDCCGSGSSTNEGQLAAIKSPPQVMRKCRIPVHNSLPKSSPSALRSTMKASGHKDPAVKERIPTTNCSFRSSARTAHSKSGPPRSASTCTPTSKTPNSRNQNNSSFSDVVNSTRSAGSKRDHRFSRSPPLVRRSYVESNEPLSCTTPTTLSLSPTANSQDVQRGDFSNLMDDRTNNCYLSVAAPCDNSPSPTKKVSGKGIISHNPLHATVSQQVAIKSLPVRNPSIPQVQRLQGCSPANVGCKGVKKATVNEAHLDKCSNNSAALSASIQTQRKVSVSACNPSRPTLSTKIKITMSSDSESESMKNTTHSRSRSGSRSSLIETQHKSVDGNGSRPSSRASLTGSKIGKNDVVRAGRPRTASGPASVGGEGPALRARSSSASSLAASRRLGSESSLNSSQNSLCGYGTRKSASSSKVMDSTTRHSFHAGSHQRYAYNKDASIMTSKNVLANTKSLIPSIGHTGRGSSSASSKAHVSGKPPLCPSKTTSTAKSLPVKDKSATMTTKPAKKSNVKKPAIGSHKPVGNSIRNKSNVSVGGDDVLTTSEDCSPTDSSEMSIVSMSLEGSSVGIDQFSQNEKTKVVQDGSVPTIESTLKSLEDVVSLISSLENEDDQSAVEAVFPAAESPIASSELASRPNIIGSPSKETRTADEAQDVQTNCDGFLLQIGDCSPTIGEFRVQNELTDCLLATERGGGDSALDTAASYQALLTGVASTICLPSFEDSSSDLDDQRSPVIGQQTFVSDDNRRTSDADRQATDFSLSPSKEPCCSTSSSIEETTSEPYSRVSVKEDDVRFVACEEEAAAASGTEVENLALTIDGGELGGDGSRFQEEGHCKTLDSAEEVSSNVLDCQVLQSSSEAETKCAGVNSDSVGNCCSSHGTTATTPAAAAVAPAILKNDTRSKPSHCERTVSKCARRLKAASSPVFVESRVDAWVSEGDLHRPWSQICTEKDVERLVQAGESRTLGAGSVAAGLESIVQMHPSAPNLCPGLPPAVGAKMSSTSPTSSQNNLFSRFSSMRTPGPRPPTTSVEGVLQKFRKSFSARFYKKVKGESPPSPSSTTKAGRHASFSSYLVDDGCEPEQLPNGNGSPRTSSVSDVSVDSCEGETIFRLGPIVWRSSKERKEKCKKGKKEGEGDKSIDSTTTSVDKDDNCHNDLSFSVAKQQEEDGGEGENSAGSISGGGSKSTPTATPSHPPPYSQRNGVALSPNVLCRRSHSTTLHPERLKRPLSDHGGSVHGIILGPEQTVVVSPRGVVNGDDGVGRGNLQSQSFHNGSSGHFVRSSSVEASLFLSGPVIRHEKRVPGMRWSRGRSNLRRSVSQPLEMEKMGTLGPVSNLPSGGLSDQEDLNHDLSMASSDEEISFDLENGSSSGHSSHRDSRRHIQFVEPVLYAEALWDHVTMDPEELAFKAGGLVEVVDDSDGEWWWGIIGRQAGWFPASFVRPRVNQEDTVEDCVAKLGNGSLSSPNVRKMSVSLLSNDQVRANVIKEIVSTERDFVRHLKDVCEGYLKQMRKRQDMFPEDRINTIFGNIEQLYAFQSEFVSKLVQCIDWEQPHLSQIGACFTDHRQGFEMYSEYCNNHAQAVSELQQLYMISKYAHFFEACRLLQDMIDISLDGFLLTPIQKICKYPLQLAELLKYTKPDHPDYEHVANALETMRSVAQYINERKRRMECLEKLAAWQITVEDWEGPDLLDFCSELIYSGDVIKVTAAWSRDFTLFLFDHRLIICKKDLLKRNTYSYKSSLNTDTCEVKDIPDGKDPQFGLNLRNAWKVFCRERGKWIVFATRTAEEKQRWMTAFEDERKRVEEDKRQGFVVTDKAKKSAIMAVQNRKNPKRPPKDKENKNLNRRLTRPVVYVPTKSGSLPSNVLLTTNKKKTSSGWFHFGSNKKTKR